MQQRRALEGTEEREALRHRLRVHQQDRLAYTKGNNTNHFSFHIIIASTIDLYNNGLILLLAPTRHLYMVTYG